MPDHPTHHPRLRPLLPTHVIHLPAGGGREQTSRARQLVAASGTRGEPVTLVTGNFGPWDEPATRSVVRLLRRLGYRAHLCVPRRVRWERSSTRTTATHPRCTPTPGRQACPLHPDWITLLLSCRAWNPPARLTDHALFCDPAVDRIAASAAEMNTTNPVAADRLWAHADRDITNLAPSVTTVNETEIDLVSRRVGDYPYVPTVFALLDQLWVR